MNGIHGSPRILVMPDGGTVRSDQPILEAERALDEAAAQAYVDMKRREFDEAVENLMVNFGFDTTTGDLL